MLCDRGEYTLDKIDGSHIPVCVMISKMGPTEDKYFDENEDEFIPKYKLSADIYTVDEVINTESGLQVYSDNFNELQEVITDYILPLYQGAVKGLEDIAQHKEEEVFDDDHDFTILYYWM